MRKKFLFLAVGMMMLLFGCGVKNNAAVSSLNKGAFLAETSAVSLTATSQAESSLSETSQAESSLSETSQAASVQDDSSVSAQASGDVVDLTKESCDEGTIFFLSAYGWRWKANSRSNLLFLCHCRCHGLLLAGTGV